MGWFWCDSQPKAALGASRTVHSTMGDSNSGPPPGCPMHQKGATALTPTPKIPDTSCPYTPGDSSTGTQRNRSTISKLNPLNYMFSDLSQERAEKQKITLDTEREPSSIPKGSSDGNWEYPSPQQMYNALLRKGYHDTDPEHVTSMVSVHNFLNEGAWREIRVWEGLFSQGLADGWKKCEKGEAGVNENVADEVEPKLVRFQGRPKDMTPKATMVQVIGWVYPSKYKTNPPFDRHDWFVQRKVGDQIKEIRYVIDFYEAPDDPLGEPVFYLDVRPAIDSPTLAVERMTRWGRDIWYRASGGSVREGQEKK